MTPKKPMEKSSVDINSLIKKITILQTADELAEKAVGIFNSALEQNYSANKRFALAISGGSTPIKMFNLFADNKDIDWANVDIFWADERFVPAEDDNNNYKSAFKAFLNKVNIPGINIHRVKTDLADARQAAKDYQDQIIKVFNIENRQIPQFDLIILGMGDDGHIASIFPKSLNLIDNNCLACPIRLDHIPFERITLTAKVVQNAKKILVLISGQKKAEMVKDVFEAEQINPDKYPIHLLWQSAEKTEFLLESQAASLLKF